MFNLYWDIAQDFTYYRIASIQQPRNHKIDKPFSSDDSEHNIPISRIFAMLSLYYRQTLH